MAKWRKIILEELPRFKRLLCHPDKNYPNNAGNLVIEMLSLYKDSMAKHDLDTLKAIMRAMDRLLDLPDRNIMDAVYASFAEHLMDCVKTEEHRKLLARCTTTNVSIAFKNSWGYPGNK